MPDLKDQTLQGEETETPSVSPAETITSDDGTSESSKGAASQSPEEERWNNLSGASQERFRQISRENNELRRFRESKEAEEKAKLASYSPNSVNETVDRTPEVESAVRRLSQVGIATDEKVERLVDQKLSGLIYQQELNRLENKFSGEDGLPKFDRDEYEDYLGRHPQYRNYAPEDVYQKMYEPEIIEWKVQNHDKQRSVRTATSSLKPTRTQVREEPMTPALIEQRLKQPDGAKFYEDHIEQINAVLQKSYTP